MHFSRFSLFLFCSFTLIISLGCSNDKELAKMEKANIETVRYVHSEIAKGNLDVFDEILTPNYVRHCQAMPPEFQEIHGIDKFKAFVKDFLSGVSDFKETIDLVMADSDKVAYVTTMTGRQTGPIGDLPASGRDFTCVNIIIQRLENGKIAETWISWDNVALLTQLGFFPPTRPDES